MKMIAAGGSGRQVGMMAFACEPHAASRGFRSPGTANRLFIF
jgi:hypothetical protein